MATTQPVMSIDPRRLALAGTEDVFVYHHGVSWAEYERFLEVRGDSCATRVAYCEGTLEIMSPSTSHEKRKTRLARLVEAWSEVSGVELHGFGMWTVKNKAFNRGFEPDECYFVGGEEPPEDGPDAPTRPDFAIEVFWTSGGLDRLDIYRPFEVPEVWVYDRDHLVFYLFEDGDYRRSMRSLLVPDLDIPLIERCMNEPKSQNAATRLLRDLLAERT